MKKLLLLLCVLMTISSGVFAFPPHHHGMHHRGMHHRGMHHHGMHHRGGMHHHGTHHPMPH